jgi:four helix bundle protein
MKNEIKSFEDLLVWKKAHNIVLNIYNLLEKFPKEEKYRIIDQLVRAVVSIPTNIAEGFGRYTSKDYVHFLIIARGSVSEVKYLVLLSKDLGYITNIEYDELKKELDDIGKMINGLINSLRKKQSDEIKTQIPNP